MNMTITKSGRNWMATVLFGAFATSSPTPETVLTSWNGSPSGTSSVAARPNGTIKNASGDPIVLVYYINTSNYAGLSLLRFDGTNSTARNHFAVGSGTTAPTENDYTLETPISSGVTISLAANRGDQKGTYFVTVLNSGSDAISVSEIGFFVKVSTDTGGGVADVLFARGVLEETVTLAAGESKTFDVTITF